MPWREMAPAGVAGSSRPEDGRLDPRDGVACVGGRDTGGVSCSGIWRGQDKDSVGEYKAESECD